MRICVLAVLVSTFALSGACKKKVEAKQVTCEQRFNQFTPPPDAAGVAIQCPAACTSGPVYGADMYTADSKVCAAAVHAGAIPAAGGTARVKPAPGQQSYSGTERNGVKTSSWGSYGASFTVEKL